MQLPRIITHKNMGPLLKALSKDPYLRCGSKRRHDPDDWFWQQVVLEVPTGELCEDGLKTLALAGTGHHQSVLPLSGKEGFLAQGLEGKVMIRKPLFNALMNLRDLIPINRGRILVG